MASSTTRPIASTMARSVSVLSEKPNSHISAKAPISEIGIVTKGIIVPRSERRKKKMTSTTRPIASAMVENTFLIERSMKIEES